MRLVAVFTLLVAVASAGAEQFWIEYDPSSGLYPEEAGWDRYVSPSGGVQRWFQDGSLVLFGTFVMDRYDYYRMDVPIALAPGECFEMQWRMSVDAVSAGIGPVIQFSDSSGVGMTLYYTESGLVTDDGWATAVEPDVLHDYLLSSTDLGTYTLRIDGEDVHSGPLISGGLGSYMEWGHNWFSSDSNSRWADFGFGVVPEPSAGVALLGAALVVGASIRPRARSAK
jgi:hypothetical protein